MASYLTIHEYTGSELAKFKQHTLRFIIEFIFTKTDFLETKVVCKYKPKELTYVLFVFQKSYKTVQR